MNAKISNKIAAKFVWKLISYKKLLTLFLFFLVLSNTVFMYVVPILTEKIVDGLLVAGKPAVSYEIVMEYAAILLLSVFSENLERYVAIRHDEAIAHRFRTDFFRIIFRQNYEKFNQNAFGDVETSMTSCIDDINDAVYCFAETLIIYPIGLAIGITYISNISLWLLLILLVQLVLNYFIMHYGSMLRNQVQKENYQAQSSYFSVLSALHHAYENIRLLFVLAGADKMHEKKSSDFAQSNTKMAKVNHIHISLMLDVSDAILNLAVIFVFYILVQRGQSSIGSYLAFMAMKDAISGCFNGFVKLKVNKASFDAALEQINAMESLETFLDNKDIPQREEAMAKKENAITLSRVEYVYPDSSQRFLFDYEFKKDHCYLIIGANGTGKSTFVRLVADMLDNHASIPKNGNTLKALPQNIQLFDESIVELLIDESTKFSEKIASRLGVLGFINGIRNKSGEGTAVGSLSGGEKKKILLTLILGQAPDILILDEPFAEIDTDSKKALAEVIRDSVKGRIIIVITHEIPEPLGTNATLIYLNKRDHISKFEL